MVVSRLRAIHAAIRPWAWPVLVALAATVYRTAQELGYAPRDIFIFPALVVACLALAIYLVVTNPRAAKVASRAYDRWGEQQRMSLYTLTFIICAVGGGVLGVLGLKLFELHRQHMASLEGPKNTRPIIPRGAGVAFPAMPEMDVKPLTDE